MALLNSKEKLIQEAAKGNNAFLYSVFKRFYTHFEAESNTNKKAYDDCKIIDYLYRQNHKGKTFQNIAAKNFHMGLSTLEDRRLLYISIFYFYLEDEKAKSEVAFTY